MRARHIPRPGRHRAFSNAYQNGESTLGKGDVLGLQSKY
jgi:hypothetical protein